MVVGHGEGYRELLEVFEMCCWRRVNGISSTQKRSMKRRWNTGKGAAQVSEVPDTAREFS